MRRALAFAILAAALFAPSTAAGQTGSHGWFATPFLGMTSGGDTTSNAPVFGAAAGWMGSHVGFEGEVADAPDFFEQGDFLTNRRVTTVMGNALWSFGGGRLRPYATGGGGLVRPNLSEAGDLAAIEVNKFGFNVGGGIIGHFSDHTGIRGDIRYIRTVDTSDTIETNPFGLDLSRFEFWRASAGLVVKF
jgi:opacity protein-like surface antigen